MPAGPGKYDSACTGARIETGGKAVILIVIDGTQGSGFSVQAPPEILRHLPEVLREVAAEIEASA